MNNSYPIGIFDSGIGGITVLHTALKKLPEEKFIYFADTEHVPYGNKTKEEVLEFVLAGVSFLDGKGIKALVIACNTATSIAVKELRSSYNFPVIGMEPAVKPAVERSKNKRVLVLATPLTLKENKFIELVSKVDNEKIVDCAALPELVELAEHFVFDPGIVLPLLRQKLSHLSLELYGTVVLGCTHFPFFRKTFKELFSPYTDIIDGNLGTITHLKNILLSNNLIASNGVGTVKYYNSGIASNGTNRFDKYLKLLDETTE